MMAKKIQSNICGIVKPFGQSAFASYECHTPKLRAEQDVCNTVR